MSETKHTPATLAAEIEHHRGDVAVSLGGKTVMCRYITPDELPVILRACNAHDEMLEALQAQMEATILLLSKYQYSQQEIEDCTSQARAAIDKAQGR